MPKTTQPHTQSQSPEDEAVLAALEKFAADVFAKLSTPSGGEREDQLRAPFELLIHNVAAALGRNVVCTGETRLPGRLGKPDYAVHTSNLLDGYVELKAPGVGANPDRFAGHNARQWKRFKVIPNLIYSDGNSWGLYRDGKLARSIVRLSGDISSRGKAAVAPDDAASVLALLTDFLSWQPIIPTRMRTPRGPREIDLKALASLLAPLCRLLREDVTDALKDSQSPLVQLAKDWRQLLFPEATDDQFADAYAQTVTFALLLARSEGAEPLSLNTAETSLAPGHTLLSRALQVLTDPNAQTEISASLNILVRVIGAVPSPGLAEPKDPWLYFYEDFLAEYDPKLRKDAGAYYTPVEVVHAQVRLIDQLLASRLHAPLGFADHDVITLDPAVGTGTYLLGVIDQALANVEAQQGRGAVPGQATTLANNIYGFEIMVGPYAVSELRVNRALLDKGAQLRGRGTHVYLTDTLESPETPTPPLPLYLKPIADQHAEALQVKASVPVIVCLGNPPYDRTGAVDSANKARTGGWVRWGADGNGVTAILNDFLHPALAAGHGVDIHNLYNLYVYFWRWALWKVFEQVTPSRPGIVSFISASSYIDGDAFAGMREHIRRLCDEVWVIDLGGEGRGPRKSDNVFSIQTPVAIAIAARYGGTNGETPANVHYALLEGSRTEKLSALDAMTDVTSLQWRDCPSQWQASFRPAGAGPFFNWPLLTDLFPWQQSGVKAGRTWVISPDASVLRSRWRHLCESDTAERVALFKDSPTGRKAHDAPNQLPPAGGKLKPIAILLPDHPPPEAIPYAYRSFDRQYIFADARLLDRPSPSLWSTHSDLQLYLTTLISQPLGVGPALTASAHIPDLDHFRGSYGAKATIPLYRDASATEPNTHATLIALLEDVYGQPIAPQDLAAYAYAILAHPEYTRRYAQELTARELHVPLTKVPALFGTAKDIGLNLLWLHTFGHRFSNSNQQTARLPKGAATCVSPISPDEASYPRAYRYDDVTATLHIGTGQIAPVAPDVFQFEVSGLRVVQSWLKYRLRDTAARKSSHLDNIRPSTWTSDFTTDLLNLLWVLEGTVAGYPAQASLLSAIEDSPCFAAEELPPVDEAARIPPRPTPPRQPPLHT